MNSKNYSQSSSLKSPCIWGAVYHVRNGGPHSQLELSHSVLQAGCELDGCYNPV